VLYIALAVAVVATLILLRKIRQGRQARGLALSGEDAVDEGFFTQIGGIDQWVRIRGEDRNNPVIFMVHGGPGVSYVPFAPVFREWEKDFTLAYWDQRGSGKTLGQNGKQNSLPLTIDQFVSDGLEVAELVKNRLGKQQIILLCHSWGTVLGVQMAQARPDLFTAYIGTGQVTDMRRNEHISYNMLTELIGPRKSIPAPPYNDMKTWMRKQRALMMSTPAPTNGRKPPDVLTGPLYTPGYSLLDVVNWFSGMGFSLRHLFDEIMAFEVGKCGYRFEIPVLLIQGESDMQASTELAVEYFERIKAPRKEMQVVKGDGHTAILTMPDRFLAHIKDFLKKSQAS
jgi:pimeloyl-ACP methyl ester carboxylesterase